MTTLQTETTACYHCGSSDATEYDRENGYRLVKCAGCGLLFVNPRPVPEEISQATLCGVHRGEQGMLRLAEKWKPAKIAQYRRVLSDLYGDPWPLPGESTWLDIGCGYGEFLLALREYSGGRIRAMGTEPNPAKQAVARSKGLSVDFLDLETHAQTYDRISLLNVYSHLPDPPVQLAAWKRLLKPGGELLLQTGDSSDLSPADHHKPYLLPDHLSFASETIVKRILEKIGFDILAARKYRLKCYPALTVKNVLKGCVRCFWPGKPALLKVMFFPPAHPVRDLWIRARLR